jgi:hypothetical protein
VEIGLDFTEAVENVLFRWDYTTKARSGSIARDMFPMLVAHPAVDSRLVQHYEEDSTSQPAADAALRRLESDGILKRVTDQRRNRVWVASDIFEIIDEFNTRIRRS